MYLIQAITNSYVLINVFLAEFNHTWHSLPVIVMVELHHLERMLISSLVNFQLFNDFSRPTSQFLLLVC